MHNDELYDRLVSGREADLITGTSRSRRYELMREGKYPQPVKVGKLTSRQQRLCPDLRQRVGIADMDFGHALQISYGRRLCV